MLRPVALSALLLLLSAAPAAALEIEVIGVAGDDGADAPMEADPPQAGGDGTAGEPAEVQIVSDDPESLARAVGGDGGNGGTGSGAPGGDGGDGGDAAAQVKAERDGSVAATALAAGGMGGYAGGIWNEGEPAPGSGGTAGGGGDAWADASGRIAGSGGGDLTITTRAQAIGGDAGLSGSYPASTVLFDGFPADGGDAHVVSEGRTQEAVSEVVVGDEIIELPGRTRFGIPFPNPFPMENTQTGAYGGVGSIASSFLTTAIAADGGDGGDATSSSTGVAGGGGRVVVNDLAHGGDGGIGMGNGGSGGDAWSAATGYSAGSEDVLVHAQALGGNGAQGSGAGNSAGDGGMATLGEVYGASGGGGAVTVVGEAGGGAGGNGELDAASGEAVGIALIDAVDGDTTGALTLRQRALSGNLAGFADGVVPDAYSSLSKKTSSASLTVESEAGHGSIPTSPFVPFPRFDTPTVEGGDAEAWGVAQNLGGEARANVIAFAASGRGTGRGGDATVHAHAESWGDGNAARVGEASPLPLLPVVGGPATVGPDSAGMGAYAGNGGTNGFFAPIGPAGAGGDAWSESHGTAHGDAEVAVFDVAVGGGAGLAGFFEDAAAGGDAHSHATARNKGSSRVEAQARAYGGLASGITRFEVDLEPVVAGGDAEAWSSAEGDGEVRSEAAAFGGLGTWIGGGGAGFAQAHARGTSGEALAHAGTAERPFGAFIASADASVASEVLVQALASPALPAAAGAAVVGDPDPLLPSVKSHIEAPPGPDAADALAEHPALAQAFEDAEVDLLLARAGTEMIHRQDDSIVLGASWSYYPLLDVVEVPGVFLLERLHLGVLGLEIDAAGFESLSFRVSVGDDVLVDVSFLDAASALAALVGGHFDLGAPQTRSIPLPGPSPFPLPGILQAERWLVELEWTTASVGDALAFDFVLGAALSDASGSVAVPEPAAGVLVAVALALLWRRRRA